MDKAILKTIIYYDIFNFPLKAWEIHKWLIGRGASLNQIEKRLQKLIKNSKINTSKGYYFLPGKSSLVKKRLAKEQTSKHHLSTARNISLLFKLIPWVKLVGISGSLSMMGSSERDDIDLFIITSQNRIWISRLLILLLTSLTGLRRKRREKILQATGKICINLILEENSLEQKKKNIYVAHEVLQMRLLWQRTQIYSQFLHTNSWAFKYLPNWKTSIIEIQNPKKKSKTEFSPKDNVLLAALEVLSKKLQLKIMGNPDKSEKIESGALYFHPEDKGVKVLEQYKNRILKL